MLFFNIIEATHFKKKIAVVAKDTKGTDRQVCFETNG